MWKLIIFINFLLITNNTFAAPSNTTSQELLNDKKNELSISDSSVLPIESSTPSSSSSSNPEEMLEITSLQPLLQESTSRRRQITYDERQEGQYNIRADLENSMILVIPSNPVIGFNLLDLLTRSSLKRSNTKKVTKKNQANAKLNTPSISKIDIPNAYGFTSRMHQHPIVPIGGQQIGKFSEFIEGRTPYKVDISSSSTSLLPSDHDISKVHSSEAQVDVIPPSYPFHLNLMKPYHLEAEPSIVQQLPSQSYRYLNQPSMMTQGKLFDYLNSFNGFLNTRRNTKSLAPLLNFEDVTNTEKVEDKEKHNKQKRHVDYEEYDDLDVGNHNVIQNDHFSIFDILTEDEAAEFKSTIPNFNEIFSGGEYLQSIGPHDLDRCGPLGLVDKYGKCHHFPQLNKYFENHI